MPRLSSSVVALSFNAFCKSVWSDNVPVIDPHNDGQVGDQIGQAVDAVGEDGLASSEVAGGNLEGRKQDIGNQADPRNKSYPADLAGSCRPVEMIRRLAKSDRVQQVFIRHVFRYFMGRNETIRDAKTLQDANRDYNESNGSMKALIVSLLTSDSFLYRVQ